MRETWRRSPAADKEREVQAEFLEAETIEDEDAEEVEDEDEDEDQYYQMMVDIRAATELKIDEGCNDKNNVGLNRLYARIGVYFLILREPEDSEEEYQKVRQEFEEKEGIDTTGLKQINEEDFPMSIWLLALSSDYKKKIIGNIIRNLALRTTDQGHGATYEGLKRVIKNSLIHVFCKELNIIVEKLKADGMEVKRYSIKRPKISYKQSRQEQENKQVITMNEARQSA